MTKLKNSESVELAVLHLLKLAQSLPFDKVNSLLDYAQFLHSQVSEKEVKPCKPKLLKRPAKETVLAAVKRAQPVLPHGCAKASI